MPFPWMVLGLASLLPAQEQDAPPVPLLSHAELSAELGRLADSDPTVHLHRVAVSREGRAVEALEFAAEGLADDAPAILLVANVSGPRVFASGVALHHARELIRRSGEEKVRALLDTTRLFVIPRVNPDAAEARFQSPLHERWASGHGVDDDRDGLQGEDGPADVNGDGFVTWIRLEDPEGTLRPDPTDPRVQVEADRKKGERGGWRVLTEGRDLDGDESVAEDAALDARVDRNFPAGWEHHEGAAGLFPTDEPEVLGLIEFILARPAISLVVTYDRQDSLVEKPKTVKDDASPVKRVLPSGILESDGDLLAELGKRYGEATKSKAKGDGTSDGGFSRWCYEHRGLLTLDMALWEMPTEAPKPSADEGSAQAEAKDEADGGDAEDADGPQDGEKKDAKPSEDAKRLAWVDAVEEDWRFLPWTAYEHPELGACEVGGFAPYARIEPPTDEGPAIASSHLDFFLTLGELLPRIAIERCELEPLGGGVCRVTAVVVNDGYLPLLSRSALRTNTTRPARLRLMLPKAATLLAGATQSLISDLPGSGGRSEHEWLVLGPEGMEIGIAIDTDHAGSTFQRPEVVR